MIEWTIPYTLTSPEGTLVFNQPTSSPYSSNADYLFRLDPEKCKATTGPIRRQVDPIPTADGSLPHASFLNGMTVSLAMDFYTWPGAGSDVTPACETDLRVMWDTLLLHLRSLVNPSIAELFGGQCRWAYQPSGYADGRLLDHIRIADWVDPSFAFPLTSATVTLDSEFPYEIDASESPNNVVGIAAPFVNVGNTETYPVFKVHAGTGSSILSFEIDNLTTGQSILFDSSLPGASPIPAGHYVEIITFRNTVYLDGSSANYKNGIDVEVSDFFALEPGTNSLQYVCAQGGTCEIIWNNAWAG